MPLWIFVVASFLGGILGAVMQHVLSQRSERRRGVEARRTEAYVSLIKAVANLATIGGEEGPPIREIRAQYAESRARIAVYGSAEVVARIVELLRSADAAEPARTALLAKVVRAMRAEGLGKTGLVPDGVIEDLLFSAESLTTPRMRETR
jgi:hypothetical protein